MLNITAARRSKRTVSELNIAPLIDMVFILLIFFLVNTSFVKETGIEVTRPTASTATVQSKATILIAIDQGNRIYMEHREIDLRCAANVERGWRKTRKAGGGGRRQGQQHRSCHPGDGRLPHGGGRECLPGGRPASRIVGKATENKQRWHFNWELPAILTTLSDATGLPGCCRVWRQRD
jgi:hypothetical protein